MSAAAALLNTFGVRRLQAARLFSREGVSSTYGGALKLAIPNDDAIALRAFGTVVRPLTHLLVIHSATALCELNANPDAGPIPFERIRDEQTSDDPHLFDMPGDHAVIVDQSFIEMVHAVLFLVLPIDMIASESQLADIRNRILLHAICRTRRYDLLKHLPATRSIAAIIGNDFKNRRVITRLLPAIQYIVSHEVAHMLYAYATPGFNIRSEFAEFRPHLFRSAKNMQASIDDYRSKKYGASAAREASQQTQFSLEFWLNEGWEEIVCDIQAFTTAYRMGKAANLKLSSTVTAIDAVHRTITCLNALNVELSGHGSLEHASGRSLIWETIRALKLADAPSDVQQMAAKMRTATNERVLSTLMTPLIEAASDLAAREATDWDRSSIFDQLARHGIRRFQNEDIVLVY